MLFPFAYDNGGKIAAVMVTARLTDGKVTPPLALLTSACESLVNGGVITADIVSAEKDAYPKFDTLSTPMVIPIGSFFDVRLATTSDAAGFVCVPQGSPIPTAARPIPAP